jgi:hypothetical protein
MTAVTPPMKSDNGFLNTRILPWLLQSSLETASRVLLDPGDQSSVDFSRPYGEPALASADSVSWRQSGHSHSAVP